MLSNIVIGDPRRPDLTVERAEVTIEPRFGLPGIGRITLVRPRLFGSYRGGRVSLGSLDPLLFTGSKAAFRMPDLDVGIVDGRALIESDAGPVGVQLAGSGKLRGGFAGTLAAVAPALAAAGCRAERASLFGRISVTAQKPRFVGPLRLGALACPDRQLRLADAALSADATVDAPLDGAEAKLALRTGAIAYAGTRLAATSGDGRVTWRDRALTARYRIEGAGFSSAQLAARTLGVEGGLRAADGFARVETEGSVSGAGLVPGRGLDVALAAAGRASAGEPRRTAAGKAARRTGARGEKQRAGGQFHRQARRRGVERGGPAGAVDRARRGQPARAFTLPGRCDRRRPAPDQRRFRHRWRGLAPDRRADPARCGAAADAAGDDGRL